MVSGLSPVVSKKLNLKQWKSTSPHPLLNWKKKLCACVFIQYVFVMCRFPVLICFVIRIVGLCSLDVGSTHDVDVLILGNLNTTLKTKPTHSNIKKDTVTV